jgi:hypothetical protein
VEQLQNNAITALDGAINSAVTSITVDDGSVFPSSGNFRLKCDDELMICTARTGNTLTVTRAAESTTAASHSDDALIEHVLTKAGLEQVLEDMYQFGGYSSRPSAPRTGTIYHASDADYKWRYNGSQWDLIHPIYVPYTRRWGAQSWTAQNHGAQLTSSFINEILSTSFIGQGSDNFRGWTKSLPAAPIKSILEVEIAPLSGSNFCVGLALRNSANDDFKMALLIRNSNDNELRVQQWTANNTFSAVQAARDIWQNRTMFIRIEDDNTNWKHSISFDLINWNQVHSETRNTFVTPDQIYVNFNCADSSAVTITPKILGYWEE